VKIYKIAQTQYSDMYDLYEEVNEHVSSILSEYYDESRVQGSQMSWSVVPFARLQKIWQDYMKYGFVRDEKGLNMIADQILQNISKLEAATQLAGHGQLSDEEIEEQYGYKAPEGDNADFYFDFLSTKFGVPISDYGLKPLWSLAEKLIETQDYVQKLIIIDRMLNVVHQRGDLAALFIEGGYESLQQLSGKYNL